MKFTRTEHNLHQNPVKTFCKRKQIYCEYANVLGYCVQTWCAKDGHSKTEYLIKTMLRGDTE